MRVLCSTTPMDGVFGPFIPLGRALAARGHEVLVATGSNLQAVVENSGFEYTQAGLAAWDGVRAAAEDPHVKAAPAGDRIAFPAAMFGSIHPAAKLGPMRELAAARPIDLIVHPPVDLAGPLLAAELGRPSACYGFGQPFDPQVVAAMADRIRPAWEGAGLEPDRYGGIYRGRYLDPRPPSLHTGDEVPAADGTLAIRPEIPGDPAAMLPTWSANLGERPAVYVSLGTAPLFNQPEKFAPLLAGLTELDLDVIVTVSDLHDPAALGEPGPNVHVERWLPLAPLLPRCDAVICHAGTGTTLAALTAALPLVLAPQGADQFDNARACERAGAARVLLPDQVSPTSVRQATAAVLDNTSPERAAALRLAREIAAMPPAADIAEEFEPPFAPAGSGSLTGPRQLCQAASTASRAPWTSDSSLR
jgi:UDP:flavonoid glycosyltransferase YjiC (YdhE family)